MLARLVLEIILWDFDERLGIDRYMYDLDSDKGACRLKYLARSTPHPKHRTDDAVSRFLTFSNENIMFSDAKISISARKHIET